MLRRIAIALTLLSGIYSIAFAKGDRKYLNVYDFSKGVDTYHSSLSLPDGFVQNSNNVFFDASAPVSKRQGYTIAWSTKSYSYTGLWTYTDSTNTTWQIARSSDQITANNGTSTVLVATVSVNNLVGEANAFGNAYFVDQTQGVYYWNGSSTVYVASSPKGSIITQFHNRLWVMGAAVPNGNQLYGSKYYDGTTWTVSTLDTDPVQYSIGLNDNFDNLTAEYVYLDTLYLFKHYTTFALYGFGQSTFQISQLTQECGCIDGNTIQTFGGNLKFVSLRGVEDFDGYHCKRISDPVKNKVDPAIQTGSFSQNSWVQQTNSDFGTGSGTPTLVDTSTIVNEMQLVQFTDPFNNLSSWTINSGNIVTSGNTVIVSTQGIPAPCPPCGPNTLGISSMTLTSPTSAISTTGGWTISATVKFPTISDQDHGLLKFVNSSGSGYSLDIVSVNLGGAVYFNFSPHIYNSGVDTSLTFTSVSTKTLDTSNHTVALLYSSTGYVQLYWDGVFNGSMSSSTFTSFNRPTIGAQAKSTPDHQVFVVSNYAVINATGTYYSAVHNVGNITSWGSLNTTHSGSFNFFTRSSTNTFAVLSSTPAWVSQSDNSTISSSTGTFIQVRIDPLSSGGTPNPNLSNFTVNWFTGKIGVPMSSTVWDNRYWLSLTTSTNDTANDSVLVLSSKGVWSPLDIHAGAFTQTKGNLYHADSSASGNIYQDNQGYSDNGNPISAFIQTKDYAFGSLPSDDYLYAVYPSADNTGNCNMTTSYIPDRDGGSFNLGTINLSEFSTISSLRLPIPVDSSHQDFGNVFNFTIGTNDSTCAWNFYGIEGIYRERPVQ